MIPSRTLTGPPSDNDHPDKLEIQPAGTSSSTKEDLHPPTPHQKDYGFDLFFSYSMLRSSLSCSGTWTVSSAFYARKRLRSVKPSLSRWPDVPSGDQQGLQRVTSRDPYGSDPYPPPHRVTNVIVSPFCSQ